MPLVAAWLAGAAAHCFVRRSQKADAVEATPHTEPIAIVLNGTVPDHLVAALPLALPPGIVCPVHLSLGLRGCRGPAWPARPEHGRVLRAYLALLWVATLAQEMRLNPSVLCRAMRWWPHILNSPLCRVGR